MMPTLCKLPMNPGAGLDSLVLKLQKPKVRGKLKGPHKYTRTASQEQQPRTAAKNSRPTL